MHDVQMLLVSQRVAAAVAAVIPCSRRKSTQQRRMDVVKVERKTRDKLYYTTRRLRKQTCSYRPYSIVRLMQDIGGVIKTIIHVFPFSILHHSFTHKDATKRTETNKECTQSVGETQKLLKRMKEN